MIKHLSLKHNKIFKLCENNEQYFNCPLAGKTLLSWYLTVDHEEGWIKVLKYYGALTIEEITQKINPQKVDIMKYMCKLNNISEFQIIVAEMMYNLQTDQIREYAELDTLYENESSKLVELFDNEYDKAKQREEDRVYNERNESFFTRYDEYYENYIDELNDEYDNFISMKEQIIKHEFEFTKFALIEERKRNDLITKEMIKKTPIDIMFSYLTKIKQPVQLDISFLDNPIIRQQLIEKTMQLLQGGNIQLATSAKVQNWETASVASEDTFDMIGMHSFHTLKVPSTVSATST